MWLDRFLGRKQEEPKVDVLGVGKVKDIDWESLPPATDKKQVIEDRLQLMKGSYSGAPGLYVDVIRIVKESGAKEVNLETAHDALATMLKMSGRTVDLTNQSSVDSALLAYWDRNK